MSDVSGAQKIQEITAWVLMGIAVVMSIPAMHASIQLLRIEAFHRT